MQKGDLIALEFRLRNIRLLTKLGFGGSEKREFLPQQPVKSSGFCKSVVNTIGSLNLAIEEYLHHRDWQCYKSERHFISTPLFIALNHEY